MGSRDSPRGPDKITDSEKEGKVVITKYKMEGLKFKKVCQFEELKMTLWEQWCYVVALSLITSS